MSTLIAKVVAALLYPWAVHCESVSRAKVTRISCFRCSYRLYRTQTCLFMRRRDPYTFHLSISLDSHQIIQITLLVEVPKRKRSRLSFVTNWTHISSCTIYWHVIKLLFFFQEQEEAWGSRQQCSFDLHASLHLKQIFPRPIKKTHTFKHSSTIWKTIRVSIPRINKKEKLLCLFPLICNDTVDRCMTLVCWLKFLSQFNLVSKWKWNIHYENLIKKNNTVENSYKKYAFHKL